MRKQEIEKVYLDEDSVKVTNSRFIVGGQTFALAGITSVTGAVLRESKTGDYAFGFLGACLALYGLGGNVWAFLGGLVSTPLTNYRFSLISAAPARSTPVAFPCLCSSFFTVCNLPFPRARRKYRLCPMFPSFRGAFMLGTPIGGFSHAFVGWEH